LLKNACKGNLYKQDLNHIRLNLCVSFKKRYSL